MSLHIPPGALPHVPVRLDGYNTAAGSILDTLRAEEDGLALHFGDGSALVRDYSTPANNENTTVNDLLTYASPSAKMVFNELGILTSGTTIRCDHDPATKVTSTDEILLLDGVTGISKTFTYSGDVFATGDVIRCSVTASSSSNYFVGVVTAASSGSVTCTVIRAVGASASASFSAWTLIKCLGVRIESARTNLVLHSSDFSNWTQASSGTGSNPVVTDDYALAPNGLSKAALVQLDRGAGNAGGDISEIKSIGFSTSAQDYTATLWVKAATGGDVGKEIGIRHVGAASYSIVTLTADWVRYEGTETSSGGSRVISLLTRGTITADNTVAVLVWQGQCEAGSFASSEIETTTTSVTSAADDISLLTADLPWNDEAGSVVVSFTPTERTSSHNVLNIYNSITDRITVPSLQPPYQPFVISGGVAQVSLSAGTTVTNQNSILAFAFADNDFAASFDGGTVVTDLAGTVPTGLTKIYIGSLTGSFNLNGHILWLKYLPRRITDSELQAETA